MGMVDGYVVLTTNGKDSLVSGLKGKKNDWCGEVI
jgi:hypothetical protein